MATSKQTALRFTEEDLAIVEALQRKTGIRSTTEIVRMAIRALADSLAIAQAKAKPKR